MQTEILEDSELDFEEGHREKIEYLENAMIKATRNSDYDTFMAMWNEMKELCESGGAGGIHYFSQFYSNDPRIKELKQIKDGPKYHSVLDMLSEEGPSESKDIYMLVENADYKMLRSLVSKKAIKRIPDSAIYYIDGQDISKVVERIRSQQMREKRIGLGLQALGQGVLLNVRDYQAGQFGQVGLRGTALDQADSFSSCHCVSFLSFLVVWFTGRRGRLPCRPPAASSGQDRPASRRGRAGSLRGLP